MSYRNFQGTHIVSLHPQAEITNIKIIPKQIKKQHTLNITLLIQL